MARETHLCLAVAASLFDAHLSAFLLGSQASLTCSVFDAIEFTFAQDLPEPG